MPELVLFRRGEEVLRVILERRRMVLGSGERSDMVLADSELSPQHVAVLHDGTRCLVEDLSGQGLRVGGQMMKRGELVDGADIALGQWRAVFRQWAASRPSRTGPSTALQALDTVKDGPAPAHVRVVRGKTERLYEIGTELFTLGQAPSNELVIPDPFISNHHLQVSRCGEGFHVRDMGSTNGTFLGSVRLYEAEIPLNTVLRVGQTELVFELSSPSPQEAVFHGILGTEPVVQQLVELLKKVAASKEGVLLLLGESGTGKELVARALHKGSPRADQAFIPVNCAALSPGLMESELFGHEKGAFTGASTQRKGAFQEAQGGTLFLDEVGELPLELQAKLLRVLESGEIKPVGADRPFHVDVRVVAATNRELLALVRKGKFREDLYYRLCVLEVVLPPLRSRRGDIQLLAEHFLGDHAPGQQEVSFTPAALARLRQHTWPGNVRELRNVVSRALASRRGLKIDAQDISFEPQYFREEVALTGVPLELPKGVTLEQMVEQVERQLIVNTLQDYKNNRNQAAKRLGLARSSLFKRLKKWGLVSEGEEES